MIASARWPNGSVPAVTPGAQEGRDAVCAHEAHSRARSASTRGLNGARDEALLTATAQNLRRLVKLLGRGPSLFAVARPTYA